MNLKRSNPLRVCGVSLIECLVYIAAATVVLGMGTAAFYACMNNMKSLRRAADDISRTVAIGELWRKDIRAATEPVQFDPETQVLRIPRGDTQVSYKFADGEMLRQSQTNTAWVAVLSRVQRSEMITDRHAQLTAWRWELELKSARPASSTLRPLFSFSAVPGRLTP